MGRCIPCEKEIINQGALACVTEMGRQAERIMLYVKAGRLTPNQADHLLDQMIRAEKALIKAAEGISDDLVQTVKPPW